MHILQPKHTKLKLSEAQEVLKKFNIALSQLPKIKLADPAVPEGVNPGDIVKIERKDGEFVRVYYRVVA